MQVAALYDVHGNLPALDAVLADPRCAGADVIVCGGDVSAGPMPGATLRRLREAGALFVRGNGDRDLDGWAAEQVGAGGLAFLRSLPATLELDVDGLGSVVFCHGSPRSDEEIVTRATPAGEIAEACGGAPVVVGGHTHVQFDRVCGPTRFVNAGSVGMPYEGRTAAFWALLGRDGVELVAADYDVPAAVAAIRATGHPEAEQIARTLLRPHTAGEASEYFEAQRRGT